MRISIKLLNSPSTAEILLQVSPSDSIESVKSCLAKELNCSVSQQKLLFKGKSLHDGSLSDYQIVDGAKLHLVIGSISTSQPSEKTWINELRLFAAKFHENLIDREAFVTAFQKEMKMMIDRLSLDDIEKLCAERLHRAH